MYCKVTKMHKEKTYQDIARKAKVDWGSELGCVQV